MQARNPAYTEATQKQVRKLAALGWYHSIELPDGEVIPGLQSIELLRARIARFPIPADLTGKRVLDIGAWDGWFSFEMERRGAEVVAVDSFRQERFLLAKNLLRSQVEYRVDDICRLTPDKIGYFDYVLFFGVLYHVKHPVLALENVCRLTRESAFVESYVTDDGTDLSAPALMEFYETTELRGQFDNWVGPNTSCLLAFCRVAGFARVEFETVVDNRAHVSCHRKWPGDIGGLGTLSISAVENSVTRTGRFALALDEYVTVWFKSEERELNAENVFPRIGAFGSRPVHVSSTGPDGWMVNCKLPPGLEEGVHEVSIQTRLGSSDRPARIRVGENGPPRVLLSRNPEIVTVADGLTWERNLVRVNAQGGVVSFWVSGLPAEIATDALAAQLGDHSLPVTFCSQPDADGLTQINAFVSASAAIGDALLTLRGGDFESQPVNVAVVHAEESSDRK